MSGKTVSILINNWLSFGFCYRLEKLYFFRFWFRYFDKELKTETKKRFRNRILPISKSNFETETIFFRFPLTNYKRTQNETLRYYQSLSAQVHTQSLKQTKIKILKKKIIPPVLNRTESIFPKVIFI